MPANLENSAVATGLEKVSFHSNPKERNAKACSNCHTIALISHTSKIMLKILQARFGNTWTVNFQMFKLVLEKAEEPEIKLPTFTGSLKNQEFQKNIYFCFIDYVKAFNMGLCLLCVHHSKLWKILKEMGIPDHLTCLLRNLSAGREATVRTGHGKTDWFQIGKEVRQGCILSPCLFNFYPDYIMRNAGLEEAQAGIKIAQRNINNSAMQMTPTLRQKVKSS